MADFSAAYGKVAKWEGGYANTRGDKGGETHRGISRVAHPDWVGWAEVDRIKRNGGGKSEINGSSKLTAMATEFFKGMWDRYGFRNIENQSLAELLFDWAVLGGVGRATTFGWIAAGGGGDGKGRKLKDAVQLVAAHKDPANVHERLRKMREAHHIRRVQEDETQRQFLEGWLRRNESYPYSGPESSGGKVWGWLAIGAGAAGMAAFLRWLLREV